MTNQNEEIEKKEVKADLEARKIGIEISQLAPETTLLVETTNCVYEIEVINKEGDIYITGGEHFKEKTKAILRGSSWGGSLLKAGWIGGHMYLEIEFYKGDKRTSLATNPVIYCKIIGPNKSWYYEVDYGNPVQA